MVILYVELTKPDETFWLEYPISGKCRMMLLRCMFKNAFYYLSEEGSIRSVKGTFTVKIPPGNYGFEELENHVNQYPGNTAKILISRLMGGKGFALYNSIAYDTFVISPNLARYMNLSPTITSEKRNANQQTKIPKLKREDHSHKPFYLHCNLVDDSQVLLEGNHSNVLSLMDAKQMGEHVLHDPSNPIAYPINERIINSIRFWVMDTNDEIISRGVYPMSIIVKIT